MATFFSTRCLILFLVFNTLSCVSYTRNIDERKKDGKGARGLFVHNEGSKGMIVEPLPPPPLGPPAGKFDITVDKSGTLKTINDALKLVPLESTSRIFIKINSGIYEERVIIDKNMKNISFIGDGINQTIIRGSYSNNAGGHTRDTATLAVYADDFIAFAISIENTADDMSDDYSQALALLDYGNHNAYYKCRFHSYQDTVGAFGQIQFFRECDIYGSVDFIFGNGQVVFQKCNILVSDPKKGQKTVYITAQGRSNESGAEATVLHNCFVKPASKYFPSTTEVYLGRPWGNYSQVVVSQSFLSDIIDPLGWSDFGEPKRNLTASYMEYDNRGGGSNTAGRIKWPGYKRLTKEEASHYTVRNFIRGAEWIVPTGIPVTLDFIGIKNE